MSDVKSVANAFSLSGIVGKLLITFIIIFVIIFVYSNVQNTITLTELVKQNSNVEKLIQNQVKIDIFKKCIKLAYDDTMSEFNTELLIILGATMQENNVAFPQSLNKAIQKFRHKMEVVKDCLIFPEELK
jgi:hypothetical protein